MKILVINLLYIGDLLFCTPLIHELQRNYPNGKIDLLVDKKYQELVVFNPHLNKVIAIDRAGLHYRFIKKLRLLLEVRKSHYDIIVNLHRNKRTTIITALSGANVRCGFPRKGFWEKLFTHTIMHRIPNQHKVERNLDVLSLLGLSRMGNNGIEVYVDPKTMQEADNIWEENGLTLNTKVIGLNPGANWLTKRWTENGFAELAEKLQQAGYVPVFFGGPMDKLIVEKIVSMMKTPPITLTGKLSLLQLAALIRKCLVFVSGDTGPMHIAASQKTPVVALFGPTNPKRFGPYDVKNIIVSANEPCSGCNKKICAEYSCMKKIHPDEVFKAIQELLNNIK